MRGEESPFQQYLRRFNGCKLEVEVSNNWKVKISKFGSGGENLFKNNLDEWDGDGLSTKQYFFI
jgi:hypothetical protein